MHRWGWMIQVFRLLEKDSLTVRELTNLLEDNNEDVYLKLIDALLRHYLKSGYLKRTRDSLKHYKYVYKLSKKGKKHLNWLNSDEYLEYIKKYKQKYELIN